jgi:hypothetical protein
MRNAESERRHAHDQKNGQRGFDVMGGDSHCYNVAPFAYNEHDIKSSSN